MLKVNVNEKFNIAIVVIPGGATLLFDVELSKYKNNVCGSTIHLIILNI